ncbi:MAG: glycosyltransferase [Patescibacteria group bacterium]
MPICLTIHTERLHDDRLWKKTAAMARFFERQGVCATWFVMNPTCVANQRRGFDELKWRKRLRYLAERGQLIEQHTHFYKEGKGEYNLSAEHTRKCLLEDKRWLESAGFNIKGFVSGGWRMNNEIMQALTDLGFTYDCTDKTATLSVRRAVCCQGVLQKNKAQVIYCHDYDLEKISVRLALRWLVWTQKSGAFMTVKDWLAVKEKITYAAANYCTDYDGEIKRINDDVYIHPHDHKNTWDWRVILNFLNNLKIKQPASVLELGCGMGNVGHYYARRGAKVVLEDLNLSYLEQAVMRDDGTRGLLHDLNQPLPLLDNSFDLVCCLGTLHYSYITDVKKVLIEMKRVSGKYILVDLFSTCSWWRPLEKLLHPNSRPRRFLPQEAEILFKELDLQVVKTVSTRTLPMIGKRWPFSGKAVIFLLEKKENSFNRRTTSVNRKKNILLATGIFPPDVGGPATYSKLLLDKMPGVMVLSYGDSVILKSPWATEESLRDPSGKILRSAQDDAVFVSRKWPRGVRHLLYFWKCFCLAREVDVVYAQGTMSAGWPALLAAKLRRKFFVVRVVGDFAWERGCQKNGIVDSIDAFQNKKYGLWVETLRWLQNTTARLADQIIVPSYYLKNMVQGWGVSDEKIKVIYNAVGPMADYSSLPRQNNLILSAGRLVPWKGFDVLVEVVQELLRESVDLKLVIAGGGPDQERLEKLIKPQFKEKILLLGNLSKADLAKQLYGADIFALNTGYEGFSHQLLEAMGAGLPVITTNVGGNPELVEDGLNGFLINYNDKTALKQRLLQLINNPDLAREMGERGKMAAAKFSEERMMREVAVILSEAKRSRKISLFGVTEDNEISRQARNDGGPDFIGIGGQRSGTSWIYACLYEHPQIYAPLKEINFFSRERNWKKGYGWYESVVGMGEFSTSYLASPEAAERIYKKYPNVKLIVSLRNPVNRAFSNYMNDIVAGTVDEKISFSEALKNHPEYINNGRYATHIKNYLKFFKRDQLLILKYEDALKNPQQFIKKIYEFIGVDANFMPSMIDRRVGEGRVPRWIWLDRLLIQVSAIMRRLGFNKVWWLIKKTGLAGLMREVNTKVGKDKLCLSDEDRKVLENIFEEDQNQLAVILSEMKDLKRFFLPASVTALQAGANAQNDENLARDDAGAIT